MTMTRIRMMFSNYTALTRLWMNAKTNDLLQHQANLSIFNQHPILALKRKTHLQTELPVVLVTFLFQLLSYELLKELLGDGVVAEVHDRAIFAV